MSIRLLLIICAVPPRWKDTCNKEERSREQCEQQTSGASIQRVFALGCSLGVEGARVAVLSLAADHAYDRAAAGLSMPGVFDLAYDIPIGVAIEEVLLLAECSLDGEWEGQVRYLPLR